MNDPPRKYWSTLVYCQLCSPYCSLDPAHLFFLRATFSCTGYVPDLFLGDRAFSVSKSCFAQAGAGTALFITVSSALSCCPLRPQSKPVGKNQECAGPFHTCSYILLWATGEELRPKSLSSTYRPVPKAGDARRGGMNSAGLTVSKSFPRPSTVTIDSSFCGSGGGQQAQEP
jgi:hypothetical protein